MEEGGVGAISAERRKVGCLGCGHGGETAGIRRTAGSYLHCERSRRKENWIFCGRLKGRRVNIALKVLG